MTYLRADATHIHLAVATDGLARRDFVPTILAIGAWVTAPEPRWEVARTPRGIFRATLRRPPELLESPQARQAQEIHGITPEAIREGGEYPADALRSLTAWAEEVVRVSQAVWPAAGVCWTAWGLAFLRTVRGFVHLERALEGIELDGCAQLWVTARLRDRQRKMKLDDAMLEIRDELSAAERAVLLGEMERAGRGVDGHLYAPPWVQAGKAAAVYAGLRRREAVVVARGRVGVGADETGDARWGLGARFELGGEHDPDDLPDAVEA